MMLNRLDSPWRVPSLRQMKPITCHKGKRQFFYRGIKGPLLKHRPPFQRFFCLDSSNCEVRRARSTTISSDAPSLRAVSQSYPPSLAFAFFFAHIATTKATTTNDRKGTTRKKKAGLVRGGPNAMYP